MNRDEYYIALKDNSAYLQHHGIQGQKWGVRRYQYDDGSLTPEGKLRYHKTRAELTNLADKASQHIQDLKKDRGKLVAYGAVTEGGIYGSIGAILGAFGGGPIGALIGGGVGTASGAMVGALTALGLSTGVQQKTTIKKVNNLLEKYKDTSINGKDLEKFVKAGKKLETFYNRDWGESDDVNRNLNESKEIRKDFASEKKAAPRSKEADDSSVNTSGNVGYNRKEAINSFKSSVNDRAKNMSKNMGVPVKAEYDSTTAEKDGVSAVVTYKNANTGQVISKGVASLNYDPAYGLDKRLEYID